MTWHVSFFHSDDEPSVVTEEGLDEELPGAAVLELTWEGSTASVAVPPIPSQSTSSSSVLRQHAPHTSTPSCSVPRPHRELFSDGNYVAKKRKLDMELAEINLEIGKAQLALLRAQAAKAAVETKYLELECEEKAFILSQQRASIPCQPTDSL